MHGIVLTPFSSWRFHSTTIKGYFSSVKVAVEEARSSSSRFISLCKLEKRGESKRVVVCSSASFYSAGQMELSEELTPSSPYTLDISSTSYKIYLCCYLFTGLQKHTTAKSAKNSRKISKINFKFEIALFLQLYSIIKNFKISHHFFVSEPNCNFRALCGCRQTLLYKACIFFLKQVSRYENNTIPSMTCWIFLLQSTIHKSKEALATLPKKKSPTFPKANKTLPTFRVTTHPKGICFVNFVDFQS